MDYCEEYSNWKKQKDKILEESYNTRRDNYTNNNTNLIPKIIKIILLKEKLKPKQQRKILVITNIMSTKRLL
jgi:hypothetical protein